AETKDEEKYCLSTYNMRPVEFMESVGWLGLDVSFAHCVHLSQQDVELLGKTRTGVCHCPTSNLRLGSGIAPVRDLISAGAKVSLAVDGAASNDSSNMLQEIKQCLLVDRARSDGGESVNWFSAEDVLQIATGGGAEVLNRDDIGSIQPGKAADIAIFDLNKIGYAGALHDPLAALVFCGDSQIAKTVIVNGKIVVDDGKLVNVCDEKIMEEANKLTKKILSAFFYFVFLFCSIANAQKSIEPAKLESQSEQTLIVPDYPTQKRSTTVTITGLQKSTTVSEVELQKSTTVVEVHIDTRTAIEKLSDSDVNIRRDALISIIAERNEKNIPYLMKLLKDKDSQIRRFAIQGLVDSGGSVEKISLAILKLLKSEKDIAVQIACMNSLGRLKYRPAVELLVEFLNHEYPILRSYAVRALGEIADPKTYLEIVKKIGDQAEGVKVEAMRVAVKCKIKQAITNMIKNLSHPIGVVRKEAVIALGELGDASVKKELEKLLTDTDKSVVEAAKDAIEKITRKK
ncbi:MAG: amidohydrolase family protein, partial [Elusimicrobiota bacterium]|nr:amidohydrolase family protein [Elusimicrobiota bacterium]